MKSFSFLWIFAGPILGSTLFNQPVIWEDLPDVDILRVDDKFYYSASSFHYSPGAPILESQDLVNWEYIGHSVPELDFGPQYDLTNGSHAYEKGIWASTLRYRKSTGLWYWIGCIHFTKTYIFTAPSVTGPWKQSGIIDTCYYDCGLLIDDDDTMYVAYGTTNIQVSQLSPDGLSEVKSQHVFASEFYIEGSRFYKVNGTYYIFNTQPASAEWVLQGSSPFGPFTQKLLQNKIQTPVPGTGVPHQGGIVDTPDGRWYYMAFVDSFPGGRTPVLAPITWGSDGFPAIVTVNGTWGNNYSYPMEPHRTPSLAGTDRFNGNKLGPQWQWNHNPVPTHFEVHNGLTLRTVTLTDDLYAARNTLTHRILGPSSTATIELDITRMKPGDRSGLSLLRDYSAYVGITNNNQSFQVSMVDGLAMDRDWNTISTGQEVSKFDLPQGTSKVWLRAFADIHSGSHSKGNFSYSLDGADFIDIGTPYTLNTTWNFFQGYRFGIFNFATVNLGGSVTVNSFSLVNGTVH